MSGPTKEQREEWARMVASVSVPVDTGHSYSCRCDACGRAWAVGHAFQSVAPVLVHKAVPALLDALEQAERVREHMQAALDRVLTQRDHMTAAILGAEEALKFNSVRANAASNDAAEDAYDKALQIVRGIPRGPEAER